MLHRARWQLGRAFSEPLRAKVPEVTARFWVVKLLTTAGGTALGYLTAAELGIGYLTSGLIFSVAICVRWLLRASTGLNAVGGFWVALGASYADYLDKPAALSGAGYGPGPVAAVLTLLISACVAYRAVSRRDIQAPVHAPAPSYEMTSRL